MADEEKLTGAVDRKFEESGPVIEEIAREVWELAELSRKEAESARLLDGYANPGVPRRRPG